MFFPRSILESKDVVEYLQSRNLIKQYKRIKSLLESKEYGGSDLKERQPKGSNNWSFRINRKYRAIGYVDEEGDLIIFAIDDHQ